MIKRIQIILAILAFVTITSCKKIGKIKEFDLNYSEEIVVPASNTFVNLPFNLNSQEVATNSSAEYKNEGTSSKLIESVYMTKLIFTVKSPSSGNFDFLNSIEIYLSSPNNNEILVASKYDIPEDGSTQIAMNINSLNLKNFLQDETYKLRVKTVTDKTLLSDMTFLSDETFHVKARLRNIFKK